MLDADDVRHDSAATSLTVTQGAIMTMAPFLY